MQCMKINIFRSVEEAEKATGLAIVIDVFRAFSTEAYLFANGAEKIIPVLTTEEAFELKKEHPEYILMGERGGLKVEGFDYGNSPTEILDVDFTGKTIIHTTSNGTKGLMNAVNADAVLAGSFVTASAIIEYLKKGSFEEVSFVSTSPYPETDNEDMQLAFYVRDLLEGKLIDVDAIKKEIREGSVYNFLIKEVGVPESDIDLCLEFNKFNFVIKKIIEDGKVCLIREVAV